MTGFLLPKMVDLHRGKMVSTGGVIWGVEKCPLTRRWRCESPRLKLGVNRGTDEAAPPGLKPRAGARSKLIPFPFSLVPST